MMKRGSGEHVKRRVGITIRRGRRRKSGLEEAKEFLDSFETEALDGKADVDVSELSPQQRRAIEFFSDEVKELDGWR